MSTAPPARLVRNGIHAALSLVAAAVVSFLEPIPAAIVLAAATLVALTVELARRTFGPVARAFERRFDPLLRDGERAGMTGATTLSVGYTLTAVLLPGPAAQAGILVAGLADPAASIVGSRYGRIRYPGGKSVAGTAAFLVVAWCVGFAVGLGAGGAAVLAILTAGVEAATLPVDDNLYLPLAAAAAVEVAGWLTAM